MQHKMRHPKRRENKLFTKTNKTNSGLNAVYHLWKC